MKRDIWKYSQGKLTTKVIRISIIATLIRIIINLTIYLKSKNSNRLIRVVYMYRILCSMKWITDCTKNVPQSRTLLNLSKQGSSIIRLLIEMKHSVDRVLWMLVVRFLTTVKLIIILASYLYIISMIFLTMRKALMLIGIKSHLIRERDL